MVSFETITEDNLHHTLEIHNTNQAFNLLDNGTPTRTLEACRDEFLNSQTVSVFVKAEDRYIGILDYIMCNPSDQCPWLGFLMIHGAYQGHGYGQAAYEKYEQQMREHGVEKIRLGVLQGNGKGRRFWERQGFAYFKTTKFGTNDVDCLEKQL